MSRNQATAFTPTLGQKSHPPVLTGIVQSASQSEEDLSWNATVNLTTDFMNIDWVYVCQFKGKEELDTLKLNME